MHATFKAAEFADVDLLLSLRRDFCRHERIAFDGRRALHSLVRLLDDHSLGRIWLINVDGATIGYVAAIFRYSLELGGRVASIDEIYLQESRRGRGIGRQALQFAEEACASFGVQVIHLGVTRNNGRACAAALQAGFKERDVVLLAKNLRHVGEEHLSLLQEETWRSDHRTDDPWSSVGLSRMRTGGRDAVRSSRSGSGGRFGEGGFVRLSAFDSAGNGRAVAVDVEEVD